MGDQQSNCDISDTGGKITADLSSLHHYCKCGDIDNVKRLLNLGVDIDARDTFHNTALFYSSGAGQVEIVKLLLHYGAKLDCKNHNHFTAVQRASEAGHYEVVKVLIEAGADLESRDLKWGANPLLCASFWGFGQVVKLLCENKVRVSGVASHFGYTALHLACLKGYAGIVLDLLRYGADINARAQNGVTPLLMSIGSKSITVVRTLLDHGAAPDLLDNRGEFALYHAAQIGWQKGTELLLSSGSAIYCKTKLGDNVLHAACYGQHVNIVTFLCSKYPKIVDTHGYRGNTPLHIAVSKGHAALIEVLLSYGASRYSKNNSDKTPMDIATEIDQEDIIQLLKCTTILKSIQRSLGEKDPNEELCVSDISESTSLVSENDIAALYENSELMMINDALDVLRKQFQNFPGIRTLCSEKSKLTPAENLPFAQILRFKSRFVLVSTLNLPPAHMELYDPLGARLNLSSSIIKTLGRLMVSADNPELTVHHIKVQHGFSEDASAILCLAILIGLLCYGQCPTPHLLSNATEIKSHIKDCQANKLFTVWSREHWRNKELHKGDSRQVGCRGDGHDVIKIVTNFHCSCPVPCQKGSRNRCVKCFCLYQSVCFVRAQEIRMIQRHANFGYICPNCSQSQHLTNVRMGDHESHHDTFVSYSYTDFWFIKEHLIPQLENAPQSHPSFELVIAHRDFLPGSCIAETITGTIIHSRKCVAVMSKNFFRERWNDFEWEQMVVHKWRSMILILLDPLEEIVSTEWMPTLKFFLKTGLYLEWKKDYSEEEKQFFWNSMRHLLQS